MSVRVCNEMRLHQKFGRRRYPQSSTVIPEPGTRTSNQKYQYYDKERGREEAKWNPEHGTRK